MNFCTEIALTETRECCTRIFLSGVRPCIYGFCAFHALRARVLASMMEIRVQLYACTEMVQLRRTRQTCVVPLALLCAAHTQQCVHVQYMTSTATYRERCVLGLGRWV